MLCVAVRLAYMTCFFPLSEGISLLILKVMHVKVWLRTLKALALTPLVLSWLLLALKYVSLGGSMGSLTSLFSDRFRSSRRVSLAKAPSSISAILFPVRSILFRVTGSVEGRTPLNSVRLSLFEVSRLEMKQVEMLTLRLRFGSGW